MVPAGLELRQHIIANVLNKGVDQECSGKSLLGRRRRRMRVDTYRAGRRVGLDILYAGVYLSDWKTTSSSFLTLVFSLFILPGNGSEGTAYTLELCSRNNVRKVEKRQCKGAVYSQKCSQTKNSVLPRI